MGQSSNAGLPVSGANGGARPKTTSNNSFASNVFLSHDTLFPLQAAQLTEPEKAADEPIQLTRQQPNQMLLEQRRLGAREMSEHATVTQSTARLADVGIRKAEVVHLGIDCLINRKRTPENMFVGIFVNA